MSFDELHKKRKNYVQAARENNFEEGLRDLLSHLYPDNAHFIYELLQNAEDAQASEIHFRLESSRLVTEHDGRRLFSLQDIESITGIGGSTKIDDETAIGKFGVGFKAVFDYTSRPEIQSGEYSFAIEDLFVPVRIDGKSSPGWTRFTFPFNRDEKPPARAVEEITGALRELKHSSLLFLSNISLISFTLPNGQGGSLERSSDATNQNQISITLNTDGDESETHWMRFTDQFRVDDDGRPKNVIVGAAFALEDVPKRSKKVAADGPDQLAEPKESRKQIAALNRGDVCIFFPAVKEVSGLRFHIHAPFASTVARDSVRDTPGNTSMVAAIGQLVVDALPSLRDTGYLTDGLLSALPNHEDPLPDFYSIIRDKILGAFNETPLAPVRGRGNFAPAKDLIDGPDYFRGALDDSDTELLYRIYAENYEDPLDSYRWIASGSGNAGRFLKSLRSRIFDQYELRCALEHIEYLEGAEQNLDEEELATLSRWHEWLTTRSNKQLRKFYAFLGEAILDEGATHNDDSYEGESLSAIRLVRVGKTDKWTHVLGKDTYLPQSPKDPVVDRVPIELAFFEEEKEDKHKNHLRAFYRSAGVKRWDKATGIQKLLARYGLNGDRPGKDSGEYKRHLVQFLKAHNDRTLGRFRAFVTVRFLVGVSTDGETYWCSPRELFVDEPYLNTGLTSLHHVLPESERRRLLWPGYQDMLTERQVQDLLDLAIEYGAQKDIAIERAPLWRNRLIKDEWAKGRASAGSKETDLGTKRDFRISGLPSIAESRDPRLLRGLWNTVTSADTDMYGIAVYQANGSSERHTFPSQVAQQLNEIAWILDNDGNLRTPAEATESDLAPELHMPSKPSLLLHLDFGLNAATKSKEAAEATESLAKIGITDETLQKIVIDLAKRHSSEELLDLFTRLDNESRSADLSFDPASDLVGRQGKVANDASNTPDREFEVQERSTEKRKGEQREKAKAYLRGFYLGRDGRVICQICTQPMPFKVKGEDYFEAVTCIRNRQKGHKQNHLALCPTCSAKFRYALDTKTDELHRRICDQDIGEAATRILIDVRLAGEDESITFAVKHFLDIQAVLQAAGAERQRQ